MREDVKIGLLVQDAVTGFTGFVTGRVEYITGCHQALVQPACENPRIKIDSVWIDVDRLKVLDGSPIELPTQQSSGSDREPPRR